MAQEPRLGCGAAIMRDGALLLVRRRCDPEAGHWGLPGGKVDWLEPVQAAVVREIREELGIELESVQLLCVVDQIDPVKPEHWVAPVYLARQFSGEPRIVEPDKHAEWGWFRLRRLPEPLTMATRVALPHLAELFENRFHVRPMVRSDWRWISDWFRDAELDRQLGPIDDEWLEHVLSDHGGVELVVEDDHGQPAALVGCVWDRSGDEHAITDLAVNPRLRRSGIGREAVTATLAWAEHPAAKCWIAFVDVDNSAAFSFFSAIGWRHEGLDDGMHRFCREIEAPRR
ncbi:GNAT family N-acetyltransferase [Mycolicibacterium fortuitum]|uniref:GNAT family N-acetyltransferase n=1 Tax=Mycolicibacterium fortuitum TaxID=1766 RepID=UPI001F1E2FC5|nr:GNAT family N-acetyltransferase [Mycolicibacterium fortuitum]